MRLLAALLLAGCAAAPQSPRVLDVEDQSTQCILQGGLLKALAFDADGNVLGWICRRVLEKPDAET